MVDFNATLSSNITADQRRVIAEVLEYYASILTDDVTINLSFTNTSKLTSGVQAGAVPRMIGGLDENKVSYNLNQNFLQAGATAGVISFAQFESALAADATTGKDNQFVNNLEGRIMGSAIPAQQNIQGIQLTSANAKAVGLLAGSDGTLDGQIGINVENNLTDAQFRALMLHEVGHVLGFTSAIDYMPEELARFSAISGLDGYKFIPDEVSRYATEELYRINPLDLGRYAERRYGDIERSFFSSGANGNFRDVFFSIDGGNTKVSSFALGKHFNTDQNTDEGQYFYQGSHWNNDRNDGGIFDAAFSNIESKSSLSQDDKVALDVIGWDLNYSGSASGKVIFSNVAGNDDFEYEEALEARHRRLLTARSRSSRTRQLRSEDLNSVYDAVNSYGEFLDDLSLQQATESRDSIRIEAEDYDRSWNYKKGYMGAASGKYGIHMGGGPANQWGAAFYTFNGNQGDYHISLGVFDETDGNSTFIVKVNGKQVGKRIWLDQSLGYNYAHADTHVSQTLAFDVGLNPGDIIEVRSRENQGEFARFDYIDFTPVTPLPADDSYWKIEAEHYIDYWDKWSGNDGNSNYRPGDDVDLEYGGTGINIGHIHAGEWTSYDVSDISGIHDVSLRLASPEANKKVEVTVGDITHSATFGNTGGWQSYQDVIFEDVNFNLGGELWVDYGSDALNFDYLEIL